MTTLLFFFNLSDYGYGDSTMDLIDNLSNQLDSDFKAETLNNNLDY